MLQALATHRIAELGGVSDKTEIVLGGMISGVHVRNVQKSRSGLTRMVKFSFEDLTGSLPAMLWPEEYAKFENEVKSDHIVFLKGTLARYREPAELAVTRVIPLERAPAELACGVVITLRKGITEEKQLEALLRVLRVRPGKLDVYLEMLGLAGVRRAIYRAGASLKIRYDEKLVPELETLVEAGHVRLLGPGGATARVEPVPAVSRRAEVEPIEALPEDLDDL